MGQEQKAHFERLFAASYQLGLADPARTSFDHIYFGFYVDAHTHKKLSSRESATGVAELFEAAQSYFRSRVSDRLVEGDEDPDSVARQLTIASIVFNDLKQDTRSSVEMDMKNPTAMVEVFDKSGGAYVIYTACRAGSIVRKATGRPEATGPDAPPASNAEEARLLLHVLDYPTSSPAGPATKPVRAWSGTCSISATSTTRTTPRLGSSPMAASSPPGWSPRRRWSRRCATG